MPPAPLAVTPGGRPDRAPHRRGGVRLDLDAHRAEHSRRAGDRAVRAGGSGGDHVRCATRATGGTGGARSRVSGRPIRLAVDRLPAGPGSRRRRFGATRACPSGSLRRHAVRPVESRHFQPDRRDGARERHGRRGCRGRCRRSGRPGGWQAEARSSGPELAGDRDPGHRRVVQPSRGRAGDRVRVLRPTDLSGRPPGRNRKPSVAVGHPSRRRDPRPSAFTRRERLAIQRDVAALSVRRPGDGCVRSDRVVGAGHRGAPATARTRVDRVDRRLAAPCGHADPAAGPGARNGRSSRRHRCWDRRRGRGSPVGRAVHRAARGAAQRAAPRLPGHRGVRRRGRDRRRLVSRTPCRPDLGPKRAGGPAPAVRLGSPSAVCRPGRERLGVPDARLGGGKRLTRSQGGRCDGGDGPDHRGPRDLLALPGRPVGARGVAGIGNVPSRGAHRRPPAKPDRSHRCGDHGGRGPCRGGLHRRPVHTRCGSLLPGRP